MMRISPFLEKSLGLDILELSEEERIEFVDQYPSVNSLIKDLKNLTHFTHLGGLDKLEMAPVNDDLKNIFNSFGGLRALNLSGCKEIGDEGLKDISTCGQLTTLNLSNCTAIENDALEHIFKCKELTSLDLSWCFMIAKRV